jgi:hypothetical protein
MPVILQAFDGMSTDRRRGWKGPPVCLCSSVVERDSQNVASEGFMLRRAGPPLDGLRPERHLGELPGVSPLASGWHHSLLVDRREGDG